MYILMTDRPATDDRPLISKISNGHISAIRSTPRLVLGWGFRGQQI